jgi:aspartyl-tRNA(Asn)/glutamyl-tRNA(Gln) amidotransferase subunit B
MSAWETVIGLEIHVQLYTASKVFCGDATAFGAPPNTQVGAISLAHPGTLPRLNRRAIEYAVRLGLACGSEIARYSTFDRKNYFYADLPKGYQITQDRHPICRGGVLRFAGSGSCRLHHIHLEEDAGKSLHDQHPSASLIDLNRAGVPLLEIVTEPDLRSAEAAAACIEAVRRLVRWLGISDGNMEEGSLRCDLNVSLRPAGATALGPRAEIKNVNSMRFARRALEFEIERQRAVLEAGGRLDPETRGFDAARGTTYSLREKEAAHDYRYFPEPDLPPVVLSDKFIDDVRAGLPPLPEAVEAELRERYALPEHDVERLADEEATAAYYRRLTATLPPEQYRAAANLVIQKLKPWSVAAGRPLADNPVAPAGWQALLELIAAGTVSASAAYQRLVPALLERPAADPAALAAELGLVQSASAGELDSLADRVLAQWPDKVQDYRRGKKGLLGFFMGELMKAGGGQVEPQLATRLLKEKLESGD